MSMLGEVVLKNSRFAVVGAGGEEIGQHVVLVGSADQLPHGQTHPLCVVACQDVAEVAGGHTEVHLVAEGDPCRP